VTREATARKTRTVLRLALATTALAAPATQMISVTFNFATVNSILGGQVSGNAFVSGDITDGVLRGLRGTVNLPLRYSRLSIDPSGSVVLHGEQLNVRWNQYTCNPFGCI
jgi:hypothetical protein